jgi:hypothetical protein
MYMSLRSSCRVRARPDSVHSVTSPGALPLIWIGMSLAFRTPVIDNENTPAEQSDAGPRFATQSF